MADPVPNRPSWAQRGFNFVVGMTPGAQLVKPAVRLAAPVVRTAVATAPAVGRAVIDKAQKMALPVLANPLINPVTAELAGLLAKPATEVLGWKRAFDTLGSNMITAWGTHASKHDWVKLSKDLPQPQPRQDLKTLDALSKEVGAQLSPSLKSITDQYPHLAGNPESIGKLADVAKRLGPERMAALSKKIAEFKAAGGASDDFKKEVVGDLFSDLANPSRANNAAGPTCSSTGAQMKMARDKPGEYADIVLDLAVGRDHRLSTGNVIKANYGESTVKSMRKEPNGSPSTAILFQSNLQHFAASNASMAQPIQRNFNPLFHGGLNKLFKAIDPKLEKTIDDQFVNKDFDRFNPQGGSRKVGHDPVQMEYLQQNLFPGATTRSWLDSTPNQMWSAVETDLAKGKAVCASVYNPTPENPADRFHVVTVLGIDRKASPPQVRFHTWGGERTISLDDFKKSCTMVTPGGQKE